MLEQSLRLDKELEQIVNFIALDNPTKALEFFNIVEAKMQKILSNPYLYRIKENTIDNNTRELIYRGYTIPFEIDEENNKIVILGIFNQNIWK